VGNIVKAFKIAGLLINDSKVCDIIIYRFSVIHYISLFRISPESNLPAGVTNAVQGTFVLLDADMRPQVRIVLRTEFRNVGRR
jgi:hypothetical protein